MTTKIQKTDEQWRQELSEEQFDVCRNKGTERAFTGAYWNAKDEGTYICACCGSELFRSDAKFDSGTGWPSFRQPVSLAQVETRDDVSHFMKRTEAMCSRCGAHLGHVFEDGPAPDGVRYCINSVSLKLVKTP
jgi:peptide-methionine (R)-S-oxide reductase